MITTTKTKTLDADHIGMLKMNLEYVNPITVTPATLDNEGGIALGIRVKSNSTIEVWIPACYADDLAKQLQNTITEDMLIGVMPTLEELTLQAVDQE